jgi:hypothetical protein
MSKKQTPVIRNQNQSSTIQKLQTINAWSLPSPSLEYIADTIELIEHGQFVEICLFQLIPKTSKVLNSICISIPKNIINDLMVGFNVFIERSHSLPGKLKTYDIDFESISTSNCRKYFANHIRGGINEESCVLDFYNIERPFVEKEPYITNVRDLIQGQIKIILQPLLGGMLFSKLKGFANEPI